MKTILAVMLCVVCASCQSYRGRSLINQIDVGQEYALEDIKEIKAFYAVYLRAKGTPLIHYSLYFDPHSDYSNTLGPAVRLIRDGEPTTVFWPVVSDLREVGEDALMVEWETDANVDPQSYFFIQFYPNTDKLVSVKLPFSQAKCAFQDGDSRDSRQKNLSFQDLLDIVKTKMPNKASDAIGAETAPQHQR